jgi:hypothetical protein
MSFEDNINKIEQYLNGSLSDAEKLAFEKEMEQNPELKEEVELLRILPKAIQLHEENKVREQLKELENEARLQEEERRTAAAVRPAAYIPPTAGLSGRSWLKYVAVAASILLLAGLFFLYERRNDQQDLTGLANVDHKKTMKLNNSSVVVADRLVEVKYFGAETGFGFIENKSVEKLRLIVQIDSSYKGWGMYCLRRDSLLVVSSNTDTALTVYHFNVSAGKEQMKGPAGEIIVYEKPPLIGIFLFGYGEFFKIEELDVFSKLDKVSDAEKELLMDYIRAK